MHGITVRIIEFVDEHQPGWVKCIFTDAYGKEWSVIEKIPVVTSTSLNSMSFYPTEGFIACHILSEIEGQQITTIDTSKPWGINAESGETVFDVFSTQIISVD